MKHFVTLTILIFLVSTLQAQHIKTLASSPKISLRGLSVVNDKIIWASGSGGKVAKSIDGKSFEWLTVKGYEQKDFRDIEAFDANTAIIMAVDSPGIILKTKDGGNTWKEVFKDDTKGMFLDAMDFTKDGTGAVIGDPINNKLFIATTKNYGDTWQTLNTNTYNAAAGGAFFAASGTNVKLEGNKKDKEILFVTGGTKSRLFLHSKFINLNIIQGQDSQGANSVAVDSSNSKIVIVGGDFKNDASSQKNIQFFSIFKNDLKEVKVQTPPHGYRSCVAFITQNKLISCGTSGVDISDDGGLNWKLITTESFNVCAKAKTGNAVYLAGKDGRIAKLIQ